jgi:polygalacturonase
MGGMNTSHYALFCFILIAAPLALAQDTRIVNEPVSPPICTSIAATKLWSGSLPSSDESKLDTGAIQSAIDTCHAGHAVELKPAAGFNALLTGPLQLRAGVTLLIDKGVTLIASRNPRDYDGKSPGSCGILSPTSYACASLITANHADDSAIMGGGVIEGRGGQVILGQSISWWELAHQGDVQHLHQTAPRLVQISHSNNFTLYGITLRNAPFFHATFTDGDGFTVWGVKIDSPLTARNTDGIDPGGATNVTITHSFFRCGDDDIAIKAGLGHGSSHITIAHNHFFGGHGITIGSETQGGASAIRVTDLTIENNNQGLTLRSNTMHGGEVKDVVYQDVCIRNTRYPVWFSTAYTDTYASLDSLKNYSNYAHFTGITLRNVQSQGGTDLVFLGIAPQLKMEVQFDGVSISGVSQMKQRVANVQVTEGPGPSNWLPAGQNVQIVGSPGKGKLASCDSKWVKWPEQ